MVRRTQSDLTTIPGVGPNMADALYAQDCIRCGGNVDRCVLYVYRLAVAFAQGRIESPEQLKWWNWKDP